MDDAWLIAELNTVVQQLHRDHEPDYFTEVAPESTVAEFSARLSRESTHVFVAEEGREAAGYVLAFVASAPGSPFTRPRTTLMLDQIAVRTGFRGRGHGEALVRRVLDLASELGIAEVELSVWHFNDDARRLFERLGFQAKSQRMTVTATPVPSREPGR